MHCLTRLNQNHAKYQTPPTHTSNSLRFFRILLGCDVFKKTFAFRLPYNKGVKP
jgi:hypothetical protein